MDHGLLYLGPRELAQCAIATGELRQAVAAAFLARAAGRARTAPKLALPAEGEGSFSAKGAVLLDAGLAVLKWYGYLPHNERQHLPDYSPLVVVSCTRTGLPLAVLDGRWLSLARTAAISCAAAAALARPDAASVGFVACGALARAHLQALAAQFPLRRVRCWSRRASSAQALAQTAQALGLQADAVADPRDAVRGMDIVVSSVPRQAGHRQFLDAADLAPGSFAAMACMGAAWQPASLAALDLLATDDADAQTGRALEPVAWPGPFQADLAGLLAAPERWRRPAGRSAIVFAGSALADAAAAALVLARARERKIGLALPFGAAPAIH